MCITHIYMAIHPEIIIMWSLFLTVRNCRYAGRSPGRSKTGSISSISDVHSWFGLRISWNCSIRYLALLFIILSHFICWISYWLLPAQKISIILILWIIINTYIYILWFDFKSKHNLPFIYKTCKLSCKFSAYMRTNNVANKIKL